VIENTSEVEAIMPVRPFSRERGWLLPPTLDEVVAADHPVRFVAMFVDELEPAVWAEQDIAPEGANAGAPGYAPRLLLGVWVYGFMTGVRSCRKLEAACREQLPYLWLTGSQRPDHNTLWRFYQAHRQGMRALLKRTVRTAVRIGLVDLALQAVDGTKVLANAAKDRTYTAEGLKKLLVRTEQAIDDLEAQNRTSEGPLPAKLPARLRRTKALREQVQAALAEVRAEGGPTRRNLTDADARLMKSKQTVVAGYNAQAVVSPLVPAVAGRTGLLITAAEVVTDPTDVAQLLPMCVAAEAVSGQRATLTLADAGYHSGRNLAACAEREQQIAMPESAQKTLGTTYHKDAFSYDGQTDTYTCPEGQTLRFVAPMRRAGEPEGRLYQAGGAICRACLAFGTCTKNRNGRTLGIGPDEAHLRRHRHWMGTEAAQTAYHRRKETVEPSFGILKEQQRARQFLLRGLGNVRAEWFLLATAFNLRSLAQVWRTRRGLPYAVPVVGGAGG
jgi:transposase